MSKDYVVEYTEKVSEGGNFTGFKARQFDSRPEAEAWIYQNESTIYWSSIRMTNAASNKPRPIIDDSVDLSAYRKIEGFLKTFHETGMECTGLIIHDRTIHGGPNPLFDPSKPEDGRNFRNFGSYEGIHFIGHGDILQVEGGKKIGLFKDRQFYADDAYRLSFYPQGFSRQELLELFVPENQKATVWTQKKIK